MTRILEKMIEDLIKDRRVKGGKSKVSLVVYPRHMTVTIDQAIYLLRRLILELEKQKREELEDRNAKV